MTVPDAFRAWLRRKYGTLERLNGAWWTAFWSHRYTDWDQIEAIDGSVHGLVLDWRRFVSDQTADFVRHEIAPLRRWTPGVPVTTNLMGVFFPLDYRRLARELDVVAWDNYPPYHDRDDTLDMAALELDGARYVDALTGVAAETTLTLRPYACAVLVRDAGRIG
jgi:beta-galactosidase